MINPLGGALHHYTLQLLGTLRAAGLQAEALSVAEPSVSGSSRFSWLRDYASALVAARKYRRRVLVTWPVLGHVDRVLVPLLSGDRHGSVIIHDPSPLVRAAGYGAGVTRLANRLAAPGTLLVHSTLAKDELVAQGVQAEFVPHPVIASEIPRKRPLTPVIRVLGQWKPDRDTALLAELAGLLQGIRLEVVGRGWPDVPGWDVRDEFVSEDELTSLITTSSAVLIPYQRFYQSGIAARALEMAVPVVGRARELEPMTGSGYPYLVNTSSTSEWAEAARSATSSEFATLEQVRHRVAEHALAGWKAWGQR